MKSALVLAVLTLNAAGPRRVHQGWQSRRAALAERLAAEAPQLAAFQEVWRDEDATALAGAAGASAWRHDPGRGLLLAAKFPLERPESADLGWGGAALAATLVLPGGAAEAVAVRLTPGEGPAARARRAGQAARLAEFVRGRSTGPFVLLGDLAAAPEDPEIRLLMDLLAVRDLCVAHGDEVCGRTLDERRVDYALIPYASAPPVRTARAAFTGRVEDGDGEERPLTAHFGLRADLDERWLRTRRSLEPEGRLEALGEAVARLAEAREAAVRASPAEGFLPWLGAWRARRARADAAELARAEEEARTALARAGAW